MFLLNLPISWMVYRFAYNSFVYNQWKAWVSRSPYGRGGRRIIHPGRNKVMRESP